MGAGKESAAPSSEGGTHLAFRRTKPRAPEHELRDRARAAKLRHRAAKARMKANHLEDRARHLSEKAVHLDRRADELDQVVRTATPTPINE
ncbi:MAG: hypothetical protein L3J78_01135 [Thermoplasmata archaeon]|nr:hypothetical protein [Thermoplasmata archaeon]